MFSGSSNVIIRGGTFIIVRNADSASLEEMGVNISQNSSVESNHSGGSNHNFCASHGQGLTTSQLFYGDSSQEANELEFCKPQVDSAPESHSAENFRTSVYISGQVPEYNSNLIPTPSITGTSEVKSCKMSTPMTIKSVTVGESRRNGKPNDDSHASAISQSHNTMRMRSRVIQLVLSLIVRSLAQRHRLLATMPTQTLVKSAGASRRNAKPNNDSRAPLKSPCLVSQSHNTIGKHALPTQFRKRRQPQFGASPPSSRHHVRACP